MSDVAYSTKPVFNDNGVRANLARRRRQSQALDLRVWPTEVQKSQVGFLQGLIDILPEQVAILDQDMRIMAVNTAWRVLVAMGGDAPEGAFVGRSYLELCRQAERSNRDSKAIRLGLTRLQLGGISRFDHNYSLNVNGERRHYVLKALRCTDDLVILSHVDLTDSRLREVERRRYCRMLLSAEAAERKRIARELHDETAQQLAVMQLSLPSLRQDDGSPEAERAYSGIEAALGAVQGQLRTLSYILHPPELGDGGIVEALRTFVAGFARRTGLHVEFIADTTCGRRFRDIEQALYRVTQEALANIVKHARANHAFVRLRKEPGQLILEIQDDGVGISPALCSGAATSALGVGLPGMRGRIEALAGNFEIRRLPVGTLVSVRMPRRRKQDV
jgi:two-component system, NarL family, sensor kinase